ncbi:hypothetical protein [Spirosoma arcticum]
MATILTRPKARKRSDTKPTVSGFLPFGEGDVFPQNIKDAIEDSDTADAAIRARQEFIVGNGIDDEALADMIVNRDGESLDDVVDGIGWNISEGSAIILHIGYNMLAEVVSIRSIDWGQVRLVEPDEKGRITHIGIFPYLDSDYKKDKEKKKIHTLCPVFNDDPTVVLDQIAAVGGIHNYYGQVLYVKVGKRSSSYYAQPSFFGSMKNLEIEKELVDYDDSIVKNGFNISGIWKQLKKADSQQQQDEDDDSIVSKLEEHQGGENGGKLLVFEAEDIDELNAADFVPTTGVGLADRYNATSDRVMQRIARRLRVPNELINIRKSGGIAPTGEEMKVASQMMQQAVNKDQRRIDQILSRVMVRWHEPLPEPKFILENLNYFTNEPNATPATALPAVR